MSKRNDVKIRTPHDVPVISFSARGCLLHETPPLEKWMEAYLKQESVEFQADDLNTRYLEAVAETNRQVEQGLPVSSESPELDYLVTSYFPERADSQVVLARDLYRQTQRFVIPKFVVDALQALKERGFRLCVISNEQKDLVPLLKLYHLLDYFEAVFLSSELSASKPSPKIFQAAAEDLEVEPQHIAHVGDQYAYDVVGIQQAGGVSYLYDPSGFQARAMMKTLEFQNQKVVEISDLQKNRFWSSTIVFSQFEELLQFFQGASS